MKHMLKTAILMLAGILAASASVFADAALPDPADMVKETNPALVLCVGAVIVLAAVLLIRALRKRRK